jgi:tetratricopeptide (TPR) repeat protein
MARRRINVKALVIVLLSAAGLVTAAIVAQKLLIHEHPDTYIEMGKEAERDGRWEDAALAFGKAASLDPTNLDVQMEWGRALDNQAVATTDLAKYNEEIRVYQRVLEINPKYVPAVRALVRVGQIILPVQSSALIYAQVIKYARAAEELDPTDPTLAALPSELIVQEWTSNLEADPQDVATALDDLRSKMAQDPSNPDIPLTIAQAAEFQARDMMRQATSDAITPDIQAKMDEAVGVFEKLLGTHGDGPQDGNAMMHFRFSQTLVALADMNQANKDVSNKYLTRAREEIERARALAKPSDQNYLSINQSAAQFAMAVGNSDLALTIYRSLPDLPVVRMQIAEVLAAKPKTRPEAEHMMESMLAGLHDDPTQIGPFRYLLMSKLAEMRLRDFTEATDAADKAQLQQEIQDALDHLMASAIGHQPLSLLQLWARFELATGHGIDIIERFSPLMNGGTDVAKDPTIKTLLAYAYASSSQSGRAISLMKDVVADNRYDIQGKKFLTRLLLHDSPDQAQALLDDLDQIDPNDADLIPMHLELLMLQDPEQHKDLISKYYAIMPETTADQTTMKARVAVSMKDWDEAARLLNASIGFTPKDASLYYNLAIVYLYVGKKDEALKIAQAGVTATDDDSLKLLIPSIRGDDPKVIANLREKMAEQNPDPVERELALAHLAAEHNDVKGWEKHLKAAEAAAPDAPRVWGELFQFYLNHGRFDDAAVYLPKLAAADYDRAGGKLYAFFLARARGDEPAAKDAAMQLTQDKPEFASSWIALGECLEAEGHYDQALVQFAAALDRSADSIDAYTGLINCSYELNKNDDALRYIQDALKKNPDSAQLREMLINHELRFGNPSDAIALLQQEIDQNPDSPSLFSALGGAYIRVGRWLDTHGHHDQAVQMYQQAADRMEEGLSRWPDDGSLYQALADAAEANGQLQDAQQWLLHWAARPQWSLRPEPHQRLADLYERTGHGDLAESEMRTALARSDYSVELELAMADLLQSHKKYDEALQLLRAANPEQPAVHQKAIEVLLAAGRTDDAEIAIQRDLSENPPNSADLYALWSRLLMDKGKVSDAIDKSTQSLKLDANNKEALLVRSKAYLTSTPPQAQAALDDLHKLHELLPENGQILYEMATADVQLNLTSDAADALEESLHDDPSNVHARMLLVQVYGSGAQPRLQDALKLLTDVDSVAPYNTMPDVFQSEAVVLGDMNDFNDALDRNGKALSMDPHNPIYLRTHIELLLKSQRFQDALDAYNQLDDKSKQASWALAGKGMAEKYLGDVTAATNDLNQALAVAARDGDSLSVNQITQLISKEVGTDAAIAALAPYAQNLPASKVPLAMLYVRKSDYANAVKMADSAMQTVDSLGRTDQIATLALAGEIYQTAQPQPFADKAYDAYSRWIKLDPTNTEPLNNIACLLVDSYSPPKLDDALQYINKAADLMAQSGQTNPNILDTQGWVLVLSGSPEQGVDLLNKAIEAQPEPEEYYHLGEGYLKLQYADEAANQAQMGLDLMDKQPSNQQDVKVRAKLKDLIARSDEMIKSKQQANVP